MKKIRYVLIVLWALYSVPSNAQVSVEIGLPHVNIGINLPVYPELVVVPGYPVYYAPQLDANFFFYDGDYWIFQDDNWYHSIWYNGPWWIVEPEFVPVFVLRIPVYYYRRPPAYFHGWRNDAPPRWGDHWGRDWERHRSGWDKWDRSVHHNPAPLPVYQRQYSGDRYPRQAERQHELHNKNYRYQTRDPVMQQRHQEQSPQRDGKMERRSAQGNPQERPAVQYRRQQPQPDTARRERQMQKSQDRGIRQQGRETRQQDSESSRETKRGQRQDNDRGRDR